MLIPGRGFLHGYSKVLTNAEILLLPSIFPILIPASPNKIYSSILVNYILDARAGAYTNVSADRYVTLAYGINANLGAASHLAPDLPSSSADLSAGIVGGPGENIGAGGLTNEIIGQVGVSTNYVGQPIVIWASNSGGDFTGGHIDNKLIISVIYTIFNALTGQFE